MKLPNAEQAIVEIAKLRNYSLDATHEEGQHKARVFASALGIGADDAEWLRARLFEAALLFEGVPGRSTPHGQRYVLVFPLPEGGARHGYGASGISGPVKLRLAS